MDVLIFQQLSIAWGLLVGRMHFSIFFSPLLNCMQTLPLKLCKLHFTFGYDSDGVSLSACGTFHEFPHAGLPAGQEGKGSLLEVLSFSSTCCV